MKTAAVIAGVLAALFALAFLLLSVGGAEPADDTTPPKAPAKAQNTAVKPRPAREPPAAVPQAPPKRPKSEWEKPRFPMPGHEDLESRDWKEIAEAFRELGPIQRDLIEKPEPPLANPTPENPMSERMMKKVKAVERFRAAAFDTPEGSAPQGTPTGPSHPAFGANLIAAFLDLVKMPLTAAQAEKLGELARERSVAVDAADPQMLPDDGSYRLDRIVARAEVLDAFYTAAFALLTREQGEGLVPDAWRNRMRTDPFSSGPAWFGVALPYPYQEKDELVARITDGLANHFQILDRRDELHAIVAAWAEDLPYDPPDAYEIGNSLRNARVIRDARRMADLLRRIVEGLKLPPEAVESARNVATAYVPLLIAK